VEADSESVGGPLKVVTAGPVIEVDPAAFLDGKGVQKVHQLPMGEAVQVFQNGFAVGIEESFNSRIHGGTP